jgi:hypothetical protein
MMTRKRKLSDDEDVEDEHVPSDSDTEISQLSKAISHKNAMDLLHSMTTSKDILFWKSYG